MWAKEHQIWPNVWNSAKPLALTKGLVRAGCWNFWAAGGLAGCQAEGFGQRFGLPNLCCNTGLHYNLVFHKLGSVTSLQQCEINVFGQWGHWLFCIKCLNSRNACSTQNLSVQNLITFLILSVRVAKCLGVQETDNCNNSHLKWFESSAAIGYF